MKTTSPTRSRRSAAQWSALVEESEATNLSIREFCEQSNVPIGQLYAWRKKLRTVEPKRSGFTPVRLAAATESPQASAGVLEVVLRNGRIIRVTSPVDVHVLRAVVQAVESGAAC